MKHNAELKSKESLSFFSTNISPLLSLFYENRRLPKNMLITKISHTQKISIYDSSNNNILNPPSSQNSTINNPFFGLPKPIVVKDRKSILYTLKDIY